MNVKYLGKFQFSVTFVIIINEGSHWRGDCAGASTETCPHEAEDQHHRLAQQGGSGSGSACFLLSQIWLVSFQLIAEIKKVFASATVTGEEFPRLMAILNMTYLPKSTAGQVGSLMIVDDKTNCQLIHILEFRRKWQLWWQQWPIWTCQRTLITQGGAEICIFDKITDNHSLQCWSNGQTVAVCNSRPSLLLGICKKTNRISRWCHFAF